MFLARCFRSVALSSAVSGKLPVLSLLGWLLLHPHLCLFLPRNIVLHLLRVFNFGIIGWGWSQHCSMPSRSSMIPLLHPSLLTFTVRVLFELLYPHVGSVSCSSSPGQMPGAIGLVSWLAGAVKRGSGCKWTLTVFSVLWKFDKFWGLQDHRVLTAWVTGGRGGASQSP